MSDSQSTAKEPIRTSGSAEETRGWIRGTVYVALFAALFVGASYVKSGPGAAVPFSLQSFAIMLAGGLLGAAYGFWSIFLVVALTAVGLPLMNGPGGTAQLFGPTGGFIWMFPFSALLIGWATDRLFAGRGKPRAKSTALLLIAMLVFGVLLLYITGVPWLAHVSDKLDFIGAVKIGMVPFLLGDAIKAVAAALIVAALRPLVPAVRPARKN
ncbi:biotin transporter BioY [Cohnella caldifontis]|uniref:biotin transporter BioY n=1 Tax=Cohnella caldifontis TaxID=3027471 RepID=UPI0023EDF93B|nr:biotin transporter BioY [Cohnella sp. YIM B05605]